MSSSDPIPQGRNESNKYVIDSESRTEMIRLANQDKVVTASMGGLFPELNDNLNGITSLLDIACGSGEWLINVARNYYPMQVVGIDISRTIIEYATARAETMGLDNIKFRVMDATRPLDFPGASFDLVNARFIAGFLAASTWPAFMQETLRVLKPGGILRLTEPDWSQTNKPAEERLGKLTMLAMSRAGKTFDQSGDRLGVMDILPRFFQEAGLLNIQVRDCDMIYDAGTEAFEPIVQNSLLAYRLLTPFIIQMGVADKETVDALIQESSLELLAPDFKGKMPIRTVWGRKAER